MAWKGIVGVGMTVEEFRLHVAGLKFTSWRPSFIAVHNTGNPALYPLAGHGNWHGSSTSPHKRVNESLVNYYRGMGWSSGPHCFVADDLIWPFTPFTTPGTHSPSWNGIALGIEMVGDYAIEDFNSGPGAKVRDNTVAVLAILHAKLGLNPETIRLHKEDKKTTHACPGVKVNKADLIQRVIEYMGEGGDHSTEEEGTDIPAVLAATAGPPKPKGIVNTDGLNLRERSSASAKIIKALNKGTTVTINREEMNGETKWLSVIADGTWGWVAARYITR